MKQVRNFVREVTSKYMYRTLFVEKQKLTLVLLNVINVVVHFRYTKLQLCVYTAVHDDRMCLLLQ